MYGHRAPSVASWYTDKGPGDIILQEVNVPSSHVTCHTYYCCLQWNACQNGGGYCGIQDHPRGKNYIFSMWDPVTPEDLEPIKAVHLGPGTEIERFGGEGEGLKSWNFSLGWKPDRWYTVVARRWDDNGHTHFGFWVCDQQEEKWSHLVTMDFPLPQIYFNTPTCCFVEDWHGSGDCVRGAMFKNGFKRMLDGRWKRFQNVRFSVNQEPACALYNDNFCATTENGTLFMQTGSPAKPHDGQNKSCELKINQETREPNISPISFNIVAVSDGCLEWAVLESSTPQFAYNIKIDGVLVKTETGPHARTANVGTLRNATVEVEIEDILGRKCTQTTVVNPDGNLV